eukprot:6495624-Pyramimonas_sp.AAC.1
MESVSDGPPAHGIAGRLFNALRPQAGDEDGRVAIHPATTSPRRRSRTGLSTVVPELAHPLLLLLTLLLLVVVMGSFLRVAADYGVAAVAVFDLGGENRAHRAGN